MSGHAQRIGLRPSNWRQRRTDTPQPPSTPEGRGSNAERRLHRASCQCSTTWGPRCRPGPLTPGQQQPGRAVSAHTRTLTRVDEETSPPHVITDRDSHRQDEAPSEPPGCDCGSAPSQSLAVFEWPRALFAATGAAGCGAPFSPPFAPTLLPVGFPLPVRHITRALLYYPPLGLRFAPDQIFAAPC